MLTSLRGVYENGRVRLIEPAPANLEVVEVVVVFLETNNQSAHLKVAAETAAALAQAAPAHMVRLRESWQRARTLTTGMTGPTLSEEVLADRQDHN